MVVQQKLVGVKYQDGVEYHGTYLVTDVVSVTVGGNKNMVSRHL